MPKFKESGRVERQIQGASQAELARQAQFNAFAFGGDALGGGPSIGNIADILRDQGQLQQLSPAMLNTIHRATFGGLARGFAPQIEAATNQIANTLNARGVRGSTGQLFAGVASPLAQALGQAQRQSAQAELQLPFQIQQAGLAQAGALQNLRNSQGSFAQFSLSRDLQERSQNFTQKTFKRKRGFFSRIGAALGGALLGGLTGGIGTAVAGGIAGAIGGNDARNAALGVTAPPQVNFNLAPTAAANTSPVGGGSALPPTSFSGLGGPFQGQNQFPQF